MPTSLLIHCSRKDAEQVRLRAKLDCRTVSGYVITIAIRSVEFSEKLVSRLGKSLLFEASRAKRVKSIAPRTTLHVYCTNEDAKRIRDIARLRDMTISGFVVGSLRLWWKTEQLRKSSR